MITSSTALMAWGQRRGKERKIKFNYRCDVFCHCWCIVAVVAWPRQLHDAQHSAEMEWNRIFAFVKPAERTWWNTRVNQQNYESFIHSFDEKCLPAKPCGLWADKTSASSDSKKKHINSSCEFRPKLTRWMYAVWRASHIIHMIHECTLHRAMAHVLKLTYVIEFFTSEKWRMKCVCATVRVDLNLFFVYESEAEVLRDEKKQKQQKLRSRRRENIV